MKLSDKGLGEKLFNAVSEGKITTEEYSTVIKAIKIIEKL